MNKLASQHIFPFIALASFSHPSEGVSPNTYRSNSHCYFRKFSISISASIKNYTVGMVNCQASAPKDYSITLLFALDADTQARNSVDICS